MLEKGYTFDYISDLQILNTNVFDTLLQTEGNTYKTLILPECKYIPLETFSQLLKLASDGAIIIVYGSLPENISGWADLETKNNSFKQLKQNLLFKATEDKNIMQAEIGNGKIIMGDDLVRLLAFAKIRRESMADNGIKFSRKKSVNGSCYFILNQTDKSFDGWLPLQAEASSAVIFNPMTKDYGLGKTEKTKDGGFKIYSRILPGESMIIETFSKKISCKLYPFHNALSAPQEIPGNWKVDFIEGGHVIPVSQEINKLISWTEFGSEATKDFSGTAKYTISFSKPADKADAWSLNLGKVCNSARIILNGSEAAILIGPDYQVILDKDLLRTTNTLEIKVSNLMANRIAYLDRNNFNWKKFYNINFAALLRENNKKGIFDASTWLPLESGLLGPVTLTPLKKLK